ncbi:hypothetical protein WDU94_014524 [Cyamophila willieti]
MKIKDWFKPNEDQTTHVVETSIGSSLEKLKNNKPLSRTNIRKWRDNIYNADTFPLSPLNLTRNSAQTLCLPPLEWTNFKSAPYSSKIINSGHTTIVKGTWYQGKKRPYLSGGPLLDQKYVFYHSHFHWGGSEHALQGESFPMEVHNVFYNEKYKSHELALKEKDGIVIVVQFCRLLPEVDRSYTAPQVTHPSYQSSSLRSDNTRSQVSSIGEHKTGSDDRKYLRSYYTNLRNDRNNMLYYNGYKPIPLKDLKPANYCVGSSTKRMNQRGPLFPTTIDGQKALVHNRNRTKSADLPGLQNTLEKSNVFIEEIAKNIRFVRTVNTSKLIHAYCVERLVQKFIGHYYFYLSGIRRHQTVYRITWIVDDINFLSLSKSQLRSFHLLKTAQNTKIMNNTRITQYDPSLVGNLFYIINEGDYNQVVSLGTPQHSEIGNDRVTFNINHKSEEQERQVVHLPDKTNELDEVNKQHIGRVFGPQVVKNVKSILKTDSINESPMTEHEMLPFVFEGESEKKLMNTTPTSKEVNKKMLDVSKQILKFEENMGLEIKSSKNSLINVEADLTTLHANNPKILYENKKLQRPTTNQFSISSEQNISSSMMNSDFKIKTSILNICTEDFYDYLQALFKKIIETIKFTIDVPYCSSLQSTDTSVEQCNFYYSDEDTMSKYGRSFENSKFLLISNSKVTFSSTCEKMLELFLPYNKSIEKYKHLKRDLRTKISVATKTKNVNLKAKKLVLKNRYRIRKLKPCNVLNVMRVFVSNSNVNYFDNVYEKMYHVRSAVGHKGVLNMQDSYTRHEGCFLDSSLFEPLSIPSFSTDFESSISTIVNTVDKDIYGSSFDSEDIYQSDQYYSKESSLNMKSSVLTVVQPKENVIDDERKHSLIKQSAPCYEKVKYPHVETNAPKAKASVDTKIPRPKNVISERKKINLNLTVQKPLSIKTTGRKFPTSSPPDMDCNKLIIAQSGPITGKTQTCKQENIGQSEENTISVKNIPSLTLPKTNLTEVNRKEGGPKTNNEVSDNKGSLGKIIAKARRAKIYAKKYKLRPRKTSDQ